MSGSSKVLLVCGFCVSFGVYTSNIQEANNKVVQLGQENSYYTQARMIATAGLNYATNKMSIPNWFSTTDYNDNHNIDNKVAINNILFGGDTLSYVIDKNGCPANEARVTVSAKLGGVIARQIAIIKMIPEPTNTNYRDWNRKDAYGNLWTNWEVKRVYIYPYQFANK